MIDVRPAIDRPKKAAGEAVNTLRPALARTTWESEPC